MLDKFGREFNPQNITNRDAIGLIEQESLDQIITEGNAHELVLITGKNGQRRLYLYSDLLQIYQSQFYCRLEDPLTREDILEQVPSFEAGVNLGCYGEYYNAYVLNKNPEFIPILVAYVKAVMNTHDERMELATPLNNIAANSSQEMIEVIERIAALSDEKKNQFNSLFITNRYAFELDNVIDFPVSWRVGLIDKWYPLYTELVARGVYKPFPHRNVLINDVIVNPMEGCMHSWGMDVMHLLIEYHIGMEKPFKIFPNPTNRRMHAMEQELTRRIDNIVGRFVNSLDLGEKLYNRAKNIDDSFNRKQLNQACEPYMAHLLKKLGVESSPFPTPQTLLRFYGNANYNRYCEVYNVYTLDSKRGGHNLYANALHPHEFIKVLMLKEACDSYSDYLTKKVKQTNELNTKITLIFQLSQTLQTEDLHHSLQESLNNFEQKFTACKGEIAAHRNSFAIQFLNWIVSILTLGAKNVITEKNDPGYYGFWKSKGATVVEDIDNILSNIRTPQ